MTVHCYINNMICHDEYVTEEAAEYLNSHPAFIDSCGCIINPGFFDKYIHPELLSDNHEPVFDRYCDGVWGQEKVRPGRRQGFPDVAGSEMDGIQVSRQIRIF